MTHIHSMYINIEINLYHTHTQSHIKLNKNDLNLFRS